MKTSLWLTFKNEQLCIGHKIVSSVTLAMKFECQATAQLIWGLH